MPISRRELLKLSLTGVAGLVLPRSLRADVGDSIEDAIDDPVTERIQRSTLSIVQGATDDSKTQFSIVHPAQMKISAHVTFKNGQKRVADRHKRALFLTQKTSVTQAFFSDLKPGEDMYLHILDSSGETLDRRIFRTLDPKQSSFKFAICSCMDDSRHDPAIWKDLLSQSPDMIFFIGDATYANREARGHDLPVSPFDLWRRYSEARETLEVYHQKRLVPILAVWDDHDFGQNNANALEFPFTKQSQKNFLTFFPQEPDYCRFLSRGPGISSSFAFRGQNIVLLDDRSFRLPAGSQNRYAQWGRVQETWALSRVKSHAGATWLMNGSQFFSEVGWQESVELQHRVQFDGFLKELKTTGRKVVFASGDVHYSEISQIEREHLGYETFEVTSSSMHSRAVPGILAFAPNSRRLMATSKRNYVLVTGGKSNGKMKYKVESRSAGSVVQFRKEIIP